MNQRTYIGPSFLDLAKGAVDTFLKVTAYCSQDGGRHGLISVERECDRCDGVCRLALSEMRKSTTLISFRSRNENLFF